MASAYLAQRRELLHKSQNADGGWGYFPGKQSWLEPTAYAILALEGEPASRDSVERAWKLVRSWQGSDGGWQPCAAVRESTWCTALAVTLCTVRGESGSAFERGVDWLLESTGAESSLFNRVARLVGLSAAERDISLKGWPWHADTSAWVEPTAHTLIALKKASKKYSPYELKRRVRAGQEMLLSVRCPDGGWNYGSPRALGHDLPSYPETTAVALLGLQGRTGGDALGKAREIARQSPSRMANAWINIAASLYGATSIVSDEPPSPDLLVTALEAIGAPDGNHALLRTEAA